MNNKEREKRYAQAKFDNGLCRICVQPRVEGKKYCVECAQKAVDRSTQRRANKRAAGICYSCSNPAVHDKKFCLDCFEKEKERISSRSKKRISEGCCANCAVHCSKTYCDTCYFKLTSSRHFGVTSGWKELRDLLQKQEFKCPYTGDTIVIGENASLDHITPSSRGGQSTIDNLQWVTATVNNAKRDLNHDEFVELIVKIANNITSASS